MALLDPRVIARKELTDSELVIVDAEAFRAFQVWLEGWCVGVAHCPCHWLGLIDVLIQTWQEVAHINVDATSVEELYRPREQQQQHDGTLCEKGHYH